MHRQGNQDKFCRFRMKTIFIGLAPVVSYNHATKEMHSIWGWTFIVFFRNILTYESIEHLFEACDFSVFKVFYISRSNGSLTHKCQIITRVTSTWVSSNKLWFPLKTWISCKLTIMFWSFFNFWSYYQILSTLTIKDKRLLLRNLIY